MKIVECRDNGIYSFGFMDPYWIHEVTLRNHPEDTEHYMLQYLVKHHTCEDILLPYNFR